MKTPTTTIAVLLCAGGGTRLRPLTDDRPKALVEVDGVSILARAVHELTAFGVRELVVATGYRADALAGALDAMPVKVHLCHNERFDRTQNAISLLVCRAKVEGRAFFKLDGDVVFDREILTRLDASDATLAVAVERRDDLGEEEMKVVVEGTAVQAFGKRLDPARSFGESIGIERVAARGVAPLFEALAKADAAARTDLYYEDVYSELIARRIGFDAQAVDVTDLAWMEIDTPQDLARAHAFARAGKFVKRQ